MKIMGLKECKYDIEKIVDQYYVQNEIRFENGGEMISLEDYLDSIEKCDKCSKIIWELTSNGEWYEPSKYKCESCLEKESEDK